MSLTLTFEAFDEAVPGERWAANFARHWPRYRAWFLHEGEEARPTYAESVRALRAHMPELVPTYERLCELAGGGDVEARMLSLWQPPSFLAGCSQGVWTRDEPLLVRNYDYAPGRLEGSIWRTRWTGRRVLGVGDCAWGLLDGINDAGLAVSLAFGGRPVIGGGFGVPLVVRYLLEVCETVHDARAVLARLPYQLAHTLTLVDRNADVLTAYLAPDRDVVFCELPAATNHQLEVEWVEHAAATRTLERHEHLIRVLEAEATAEAFVAGFLAPPLHSTAYASGAGTLYTAAYRPVAGSLELVWPGARERFSFDEFAEGARHVTLPAAAAA